MWRIIYPRISKKTKMQCLIMKSLTLSKYEYLFFSKKGKTDVIFITPKFCNKIRKNTFQNWVRPSSVFRIHWPLLSKLKLWIFWKHAIAEFINSTNLFSTHHLPDPFQYPCDTMWTKQNKQRNPSHMNLLSLVGQGEDGGKINKKHTK